MSMERWRPYSTAVERWEPFWVDIQGEMNRPFDRGAEG